MSKIWPLWAGVGEPVRLDPTAFDLSDASGQVTADNSTREYFDVEFSGSAAVPDLLDADAAIWKAEIEAPPDRAGMIWVWVRPLDPTDPTQLDKAGIPDPCLVGAGVWLSSLDVPGRMAVLLRNAGVLEQGLQTLGSLAGGGDPALTVQGWLEDKGGGLAEAWDTGHSMSGIAIQSNGQDWSAEYPLPFAVGIGDQTGSAPAGGHRLVFDVWALAVPWSIPMPWQ